MFCKPCVVIRLNMVLYTLGIPAPGASDHIILMQKKCKMKDIVVMKQSSRKQIFESKTLHFRIKIK